MHRVEAGPRNNGVEFRPFAFHHLRHKYAIEYMRSGGYIYDLQKLWAIRPSGRLRNI